MFIVFIVHLFGVNILLASPNIDQLSNQVLELRKEVELINDDYKIEREKALSEIKAFSIQKAELATNIRNEEIRKKQFNDKIAQLRKQIGESSVESKDLKPLVLRTLEELKKWVRTSLPFKNDERLETVATLQKRLEKREITPMKAANHLWALIEDEKRLARETSLHRQTISLNQKLYLAEVVKVGMMFLYFKTDQGHVGMAQKSGDTWNFKVFESKDKETQTLTFFESLKKQIRQGFFEIPTQI